MSRSIVDDDDEDLIDNGAKNFQDRGKQATEPVHTPALTEIRRIREPSSTSCGNSHMNLAGRKLQVPASPGPGDYVAARPTTA
jgi:hypothetical protein